MSNIKLWKLWKLHERKAVENEQHKTVKIVQTVRT